MLLNEMHLHAACVATIGSVIKHWLGLSLKSKIASEHVFELSRWRFKSHLPLRVLSSSVCVLGFLECVRVFTVYSKQNKQVRCLFELSALFHSLWTQKKTQYASLKITILGVIILMWRETRERWNVMGISSLKQCLYYRVLVLKLLTAQYTFLTKLCQVCCW